MPEFNFTAERSTDPADQIEGMTCERAIISANFHEADEARAWKLAYLMLPVRGVWICHLSSGGVRFRGRRVTKSKESVV